MKGKGVRNTIANCCFIKNKPKSLFNFYKKAYCSFEGRQKAIKRKYGGY